ncbi:MULTISPECIES: hypothetical protein [unclassified Oleiphilus]|uniref:hypothetical protein n=1 Tax=unclassified Oleiphilus TaxID=2631174 RepID=UPI0007C22622|nr:MULTISPECIES: hypothetical protein [unclassified Oleiphilus]KZY41160.1 hypothetical protein A3732_18695 [Oleiphilus sp. HI0050]KZY61227.1 hypothetical protein A3735_11150 [Oleiphilus sp. HI0061]KZZ34277.1 hypothetical protein A3757_18070 [Oleiphilus sp. HI0117]KZZ53211.1 hypothetical protein A3761_17760 [Oleiphilus sp. HI0123]KZZ74676.1 hypothetical protein A3766_18195 [Oleiphilus sp. HI0132]
MTLDQGQLERLRYLCRIVSKEITHLQYSEGKLFAGGFDEEKAAQLDTNPDLAEVLEAYVGRFCRLQDTVGDKLLVAWLKATQEKVGVAIDNLDRAEKLGYLESSDTWLELRRIRNQMIHEYIEDAGQLSQAINLSKDNIPLIVNFAQKLISDLQGRFDI